MSGFPFFGSLPGSRTCVFHVTDAVTNETEPFSSQKAGGILVAFLTFWTGMDRLTV